jgi:lipopolysaccharide export system permease protein
MRIFDRYIGRQVFVATFIAVLVLSVVMVLGNIYKRLLGLPTEVLREMPVGLLLEFVGYALVASLPFTVPWSLLTAVLLVFGRMSADNEMLSVRMAGWSFARVCAPIFFLALAGTALCFWINLRIAPLAEGEIKRLPAIVATSNPKGLLAPNRVINQIDDYIVYIGGKDGNGELTNFQIIMLGEKRFPTDYISARRVTVADNKQEQALDLSLHDSVVIRRDRETEGIRESGPRNVQRIKDPIEASFFPLSVPLRNLYQKLERVTPSMMSLGELVTKLGEQSTLALEQPPPKKGDASAPRHRACELRTEIHRRFSFSLACFVFALVGMPLGVTAQRRETSIGFGLSLMIGIVYVSFFILVGDVFKSNPRAYPFLLVWVPNILFLGLGGWLFWRLQRR